MSRCRSMINQVRKEAADRALNRPGIPVLIIQTLSLKIRLPTRYTIYKILSRIRTALLKGQKVHQGIDDHRVLTGY